MTAANDKSLDIEALAREMAAAARAVLAGRGRALRQLGEAEIRVLAGVLADIGSRFAKGEIDRKEARALASIHQHTVNSVLRSVEGLTVIAARETLKAVTGVAAAALNRILGFRLL